MKSTIRKMTVLVGALALGTAATWPVLSSAEIVRRVEADRVPREVRRTLDEERGAHEVLSIQYVDQDGKVFYRCTVALPHGERMIRIQPGGNLLSVEDIREKEVETFHAKPDDWHREHEDRERARRAWWAELDANCRGTPRDPERVRLEECPGGVQATFAREAWGARVDYIVRYRDGDHVIYQTNVPDGRDHVRMIQVTTDGTLFHTGEFTHEGHAAPGDWHARTIDFEDLPRSIRAVLDRNYRDARIPHIDMTTRRGQRLYSVQIEEPRHDRFLVIDEDGEVLSDIVGHDYRDSRR